MNNTIEYILIYILRTGCIPEHVSIIMDGNRRYAKSKGSIDHAFGHAKGAEKLTKVIKVLDSINAKKLSVFALSIDNLKRSQQEIDGIYNLGFKWMKNALNKSDVMERMKFMFYGDYDLFPIAVKNVIDELTSKTRDNKSFLLNIYAPYTSKFEQLTQVNKFIKTKDQESWRDIERKIDILVRTSGEKRLSDFLTWQFAEKHNFLFFTNALWPEFGLIEILIMMFEFHVYNLYNNIMKIINNY